MEKKKYSQETVDLMVELSYTFGQIKGLIEGFSNGVSMGLGIKKAFKNFVEKVKELKGEKHVTWIDVD